MGALEKKARYTYADYYAWDDGERCELIDGVLYAMSPAPRQYPNKPTSSIITVATSKYMPTSG